MTDRPLPHEIALEWSHGAAIVSPVAGMLRSARLLADGRWIAPFATAPWNPDDAATTAEPGHIRALGGEFVALPFGSAPTPIDPTPGWSGRTEPAPEPPHGPVADRPWQVVSRSASRVTLALDLAEPDPIARVERTISGAPDAPALDFELTVIARRDHRAPLGLHPIFRLPEQAGTLELDAAFREGRTYPGTIAGGSDLVRPGRTFTSLDAVPGVAGPVSLRRLPLESTTEEVVQLLDATPPVRLRWSSGETITVHWDAHSLPSLLLWIADRHLAAPPWSGRYRGLGVEPIASAFDLPPAVSTTGNPIARSGTATSVAFRAGHPWRTAYRIEASFV